MTNQSDIFGAGAGGLGMPVIKRLKLPPTMKTTGTTTAADATYQAVLPGFIGNGDKIVLPLTAGSNLTYNDNTGAVIWVKSDAGMFVGADYWGGFFFKGALMYTVTEDNATTPKTIQLASIDVAGTVVEIGSSQLDVDFSGSTTGGWNTESHNSGARSAFFDTGSGDIVYMAEETTKTQFVTLSITTGLLTNNVTDVGPQGTLVKAYTPYMTPKGNYFGNTNSGTGIFLGRLEPSVIGNGPLVSKVTFAPDPATIEMLGLSHNRNDLSRMVQYQNDSTGVNVVTPCAPLSVQTRRNAQFYDRLSFEEWIDSMMSYMGYGE